ncbi:uncharacterized protein VP01_3881g2 [Puccinia sorghi]|uniref:Reverse transcriptase Ty1/copia-type domain-containing protein n=1 Tax=Puccinia sorghi TaxID=27349 RepID=A0A0L6USU4_9BASI|nr:uncharacterized protein VP01_3881g2 [Puccinia sorghi]
MSCLGRFLAPKGRQCSRQTLHAGLKLLRVQGSQHIYGFGFTYAPTGRSTSLNAAIIKLISSKFHMEDLGEAQHILAIKLTKSAVLHLLRFLFGTKAHRLLLDGAGNLSDVKIYTDTNSTNCTDDRCSYSGYITKLGGCVLSWRSKKQQTASTSPTKAKYHALFEFKSHKRFEIFVDNQSALALATNPIFQQQSNHIYIIYHWLQEIHNTALIHINYISTNLMLADVCTNLLENQNTRTSFPK